MASTASAARTCPSRPSPPGPRAPSSCCGRRSSGPSARSRSPPSARSRTSRCCSGRIRASPSGSRACGSWAGRSPRGTPPPPPSSTSGRTRRPRGSCSMPAGRSCMMPLDVTHQALFTDADVERLVAVGTRPARIFADLLRFFARFHRERYGWDGSPIHDAVAVGHLAVPDLVRDGRLPRRHRDGQRADPRADRRRPARPDRAAAERRGRGVDRPAPLHRHADRGGRVDRGPGRGLRRWIDPRPAGRRSATSRSGTRTPSGPRSRSPTAGRTGSSAALARRPALARARRQPRRRRVHHGRPDPGRAAAARRPAAGRRQRPHRRQRRRPGRCRRTRTRGTSSGSWTPCSPSCRRTGVVTVGIPDYTVTPAGADYGDPTQAPGGDRRGQRGSWPRSPPSGASRSSTSSTCRRARRRTARSWRRTACTRRAPSTRCGSSASRRWSGERLAR